MGTRHGERPSPITATAVNCNIADLFEMVVDALPDRLALVSGNVRLTYRDLDQRSSQLAHYLLDARMSVGTFVGVLARNRAEWLEAMLGCFKARMVPVNLNFRYVAPELRYVVENADLGALIFERAFSQLVGEACRSLRAGDHLIVLEDGSPPADDSESADVGAENYEDALTSSPPARAGLPERSGDDLYVLYTGGTTGMPKGVLWRQEDLYLGPLGGAVRKGGPIRSCEDMANRLLSAQSRQVVLVTPPLMHGTGQWISLGSLLSGSTVILYAEATFDAGRVWELVADERVTMLVMVGDVMGRPLLESFSQAGDISSLSTIVTSGAPLSATVRDEFLVRIPGLRIINRLGSSESGTIATGSGSESGDASKVKGTFSVTDDTAVLDDQLQPLVPGDGKQGRLARRGHIPLGYFKDDKKTAATFVVDASGVRWVLPGDFASVLEDGSIVLLGRGSSTINSGGEKVFPQEVEEALKAHPSVLGAIVVGVPDERYGEAVAAVVQARSESPPSVEALAAFCRQHIAGYKVPKRIVLVRELPLTSVGKPDLQAAGRLLESQPE
jgi:acyl-CoA synthetase (AMP-forming)/AMP-acid ligase II